MIWASQTTPRPCSSRSRLTTLMVPATESVSIWKAWHAAGRPAELHLFQTGGHGFGMKRLGLGSDAWIPLFETWMRSLELLDPAARHAAPWVVAEAGLRDRRPRASAS